MTKRMFVYELPYSVRKSLCVILDASGKWEELGGEHMGFDYTYLQSIRRRESSPTDSLLTEWGNQNHTVTDLFVLLSRMQNYRAMSLIKEFVSEQHHQLLRQGEELLSQTSSISKKGPLLRTPKGLNQRHQSNHEQTLSKVHNVRAAKTSAPFPKLFKDNKDLGLSVHNLNLDDRKPENKVKCSAVNKEDKLKNTPVVQTKHQNKQIFPVNERKFSDLTSILLMEGRSPRIDFLELQAATNGWDTSCILGRGGFGTVFKGTWKNTTVAIKKLENQIENPVQTSEVNSYQLPPSLRELRYLNSHRHDNILSLYGYSVSDKFTCLVYQYMANGSLEDCLHNTRNKRLRKLNWDQRLNIMTGTARGIQFLHSLGSQPLVHGDIKSANILLDSQFEPRLGDFGLAREAPTQNYTHVEVSRVYGTRPYLPNEFLRGKQFSVKVDTYSFGVVLFEVATGLRAYDENRKNKFLKDHVVSHSGDLSELADPLAAGLDYFASSGLLTLGINCVKDRPKERPDMKSVLNDVEMLYNSYKDTEKAAYLARNCSLTPKNPMQMQVAHDEQRNYTEQRHPLQRTLSPDAHCFCQAVGPVQVMFADQTGLPQPIIIHHPPILTVQPPSCSPSLSPSPQVDNKYEATLAVHSNDIPLVTLLGAKPEPGCK